MDIKYGTTPSQQEAIETFKNSKEKTFNYGVIGKLFDPPLQDSSYLLEKLSPFDKSDGVERVIIENPKGLLIGVKHDGKVWVLNAFRPGNKKMTPAPLKTFIRGLLKDGSLPLNQTFLLRKTKGPWSSLLEPGRGTSPVYGLDLKKYQITAEEKAKTKKPTVENVTEKFTDEDDEYFPFDVYAFASVLDQIDIPFSNPPSPDVYKVEFKNNSFLVSIVTNRNGQKYVTGVHPEYNLTQTRVETIINALFDNGILEAGKSFMTTTDPAPTNWYRVISETPILEGKSSPMSSSYPRIWILNPFKKKKRKITKEIKIRPITDLDDDELKDYFQNQKGGYYATQLEIWKEWRDGVMAGLTIVPDVWWAEQALSMDYLTVKQPFFAVNEKTPPRLNIWLVEMDGNLIFQIFTLSNVLGQVIVTNIIDENNLTPSRVERIINAMFEQGLFIEGKAFFVREEETRKKLWKRISSEEPIWTPPKEEQEDWWPTWRLIPSKKKQEIRIQPLTNLVTDEQIRQHNERMRPYIFNSESMRDWKEVIQSIGIDGFLTNKRVYSDDNRLIHILFDAEYVDPYVQKMLLIDTNPSVILRGYIVELDNVMVDVFMFVFSQINILVTGMTPQRGHSLEPVQVMRIIDAMFEQGILIEDKSFIVKDMKTRTFLYPSITSNDPFYTVTEEDQEIYSYRPIWRLTPSKKKATTRQKKKKKKDESSPIAQEKPKKRRKEPDLIILDDNDKPMEIDQDDDFMVISDDDEDEEVDILGFDDDDDDDTEEGLPPPLSPDEFERFVLPLLEMDKLYGVFEAGFLVSKILEIRTPNSSYDPVTQELIIMLAAFEPGVKPIREEEFRTIMGTFRDIIVNYPNMTQRIQSLGQTLMKLRNPNDKVTQYNWARFASLFNQPDTPPTPQQLTDIRTNPIGQCIGCNVKPARYFRRNDPTSVYCSVECVLNH